MEIFILRDVKVNFEEDRENDGWITKNSGFLQTDIVSTKDDGTNNKVYCDYLSKAIVEIPWSTKSKDNPKVNWDIEVKISRPMQHQTDIDVQTVGRLKIISRNKSREISLFRVLHEMFNVHTIKHDSTDNILVNVSVKNFGWTSPLNNYEQSYCEAKGLKLTDTESKRIECSFSSLMLPEIIYWNLNSSAGIPGTLTMSLVLSDSALSMLYNKSVSPEVRFGHLKEALDNESCTDTEILIGFPPNQEAVKCHRLMLVAGSQVFKSMFESGMKEAEESKIEIPEMSEKGVRALLAFLYYRGMTTVYANAEVAVEILQAAEKYGIENLKNETREIFLARGYDWFTVNAALELLLFAEKFCCNDNTEVKNVPLGNELERMSVDEDPNDFWESLKRKSVKVLKWYAKWKPKVVMESAKYQEIFRENPKLGMEVGLYFLQV